MTTHRSIDPQERSNTQKRNIVQKRSVATHRARTKERSPSASAAPVFPLSTSTLSKLREPSSAEQQVANFKRLPWPKAIVDPTLQLTADDTFEVGRLIVEVIHGGSRDTQKARKAWSLRRIQQQVLGEASFATLARCVQTYETCRGLGLQPPLGDVRAGHLLGLAHVRPAKQRMLLRRVDEQRLSVEQLRQSTGRAGQRTRRGKPAVIKALDALRKHNLLEDVDSLQDLPRAEGKKVRQQVAQLRQELLTLEKQLRRLGFA